MADRSSRASALLISCLGVLLLSPMVARSADDPALVVSEAPRDGIVPVTLNRLWSVGLDDDILFGRITQVVESPGGEIYVLDHQLHEIHVFSPEGEWLRTIGQEGEAPGEFMRPSDLFLLGDGTVAVVQSNPPKVALMRPDGTPLDNHPIPDPHEGLRILSRGLARADGLILASSGMFMAQGKMETQTRVFAVDDEGHETVVFFADQRPVNLMAGEFDEEDMSGIGDVWTLTTDGELVVAPDRNSYRLHVYAPDGTLRRIVERPFEPHVRSAEERDAVAGRYSMDINGREMKVQVSDTDRVIDGIHAIASGGYRTLLRERYGDEADDFVARLDVFDHAGQWVEQLRLRGDADLDYDRLVFTGDRVYVVRNAHDLTPENVDSKRPYDEPLHLVCYELVR